MIDKENFIKTSDGIYLYYEDKGKGVPLLLVPGFMCTTVFFERNIQELAKKFRVITFDPRGHGRSSKTSKKSNLSGYADDIGEVMQQLELKNVILCGWSLAGSAAVMYCSKFNCRNLSGVAIIDTPLYPFGNAEWNSYGYKGYQVDEYLEMMGKWFWQPEIYYERFINNLIMRDFLESEKTVIRKEIGKMPCWTGYEVHYDFCQTDCVSLLEQINIPIAFFAADSRLYSQGVDMARHYLTCVNVPAKLYEYYKGGHMLFYDEAQKFHNDLENFSQLCAEERGGKK